MVSTDRTAGTAPDSSSGTEQHDIRFWFDPACPWAWMTSRWLKEVQRQRPHLNINWHMMSLSALNEGRDLPEKYQTLMSELWGPARVLMHIEQHIGVAALDGLYTSLGNRIHLNQRRDWRAVLEESLAENNLDAALMHAYDDAALDEALRTRRAEVVNLVGEDVGTPAIAVGDVAFFGPVVSPAPKGAAALQLFDGVVACAGVPGFFELKRTRTVEPQFD